MTTPSAQSPQRDGRPPAAAVEAVEPGEPRRPRRFRRLGRLRPRLVVTVALAAAVTAIAVATSSYLLVRDARYRGETDDAVAQARFNLELAAERLSEAPTLAEVGALLHVLERRAGFQTVVRLGRQVFQTSIALDARAIPARLEEPVVEGRVVATRARAGGAAHVVVGGAVQPDGPELWFFFPLDDVEDDLAALGRVLAGSAAVMVLLSGLVGVLAARGLLAPIGRARDAARRIEGGDLATRLPDDDGADELAELSRRFNAMAGALERTVADLRVAEAGHRRFVADVSHELRTPVTALSTAADVLSDRLDALPARDRPVAQLLVTESIRLRRLVEDLMEISRTDAGTTDLDLERVDLGRLVRAVVDERNVADQVDLAQLGACEVQADRRRLHRVVANLLDNALGHGAPPVEVATRRKGDEAVLEVRDHGPGIDEAHLPHVFERFFRSDPARVRGGSSGLGLAIASDDVALHGGRVTAGNHPDGGAVLTVTLPAAPASGADG